MRKCKDIIKELEAFCPPWTAEEWDNVGLLAGSDEKEVRKVYVSLDLTDEALKEASAWGADLVLTHHPLIFSAIKRINNQDFIGRRLLDLIRRDMAYYAMHTNYDICRMADLSAEYLDLSECRVLMETGTDQEGKAMGIGRVGTLPRPMNLEQCAAFVKEKLDLPQVTVYGDLLSQIHTLAVSTGSGKSMVDLAAVSGAEVLVTGDIDHHTGIDAVAKGIAVIDAGHYGTEYIYMKDMDAELGRRFPDLEVRTAGIKLPYNLI